MVESRSIVVIILRSVRKHSPSSQTNSIKELHHLHRVLVQRAYEMSDASGTSDIVGSQILDMIRPAVPSMDKLTPTTRLKQSKPQEPSPASTLGDSATDSSNPATPQDSRVHGK